LVYVYGHANPRGAGIAKALTLDEARRIASNIAKLPELLGFFRRDAAATVAEADPICPVQPIAVGLMSRAV
jgi:hypothetical protein